jgi:hypothetical protein
MPGIAGEFAWLGQLVHCRRSAFLLLHTANDAYLITQLAARFGDGMDMKPRRLRLCERYLLAKNLIWGE